MTSIQTKPRRDRVADDMRGETSRLPRTVRIAFWPLEMRCAGLIIRRRCSPHHSRGDRTHWSGRGGCHRAVRRWRDAHGPAGSYRRAQNLISTRVTKSGDEGLDEIAVLVGDRGRCGCSPAVGDVGGTQTELPALRLPHKFATAYGVTPRARLTGRATFQSPETGRPNVLRRLESAAPANADVLGRNCGAGAVLARKIHTSYDNIPPAGAAAGSGAGL